MTKGYKFKNERYGLYPVDNREPLKAFEEYSNMIRPKI